MDDSRRQERLNGRLHASPKLAEAVRERIAAGDVPPPFADALPAGTDLPALDRGLEITGGLSVIEAIVQRIGRPPLLIKNGRVELEPLDDFPSGTDQLITGLESSIGSVGRVELLNHAMAWAGTGWVIDATGSSRLVATNRHVAALVARRAASGEGTFLRSPLSGVRYGMEIDFNEEVGATAEDARPYGITKIIYLADGTAPDVALLQIDGDDLPAPLELAETDAAVADLVAIIGYPAFDSRNSADDQARYFRDLYDVKRLSPGVVLQALSGQTALQHDCTTLGGNSGSPLIRLTDRRVVGLHFAGVYGKENSAVGVSTLKRLLTADGRSAISVPSGGGQPVVTEATGDGVHRPDELAGRAGYDPAFLGDGLAAPWPVLTDEVLAGVARPSDQLDSDRRELCYTHFGVLFSLLRRQPLLTAVNIDGRSLVALKRSRDKWYADARIPLDRQLGKSDYDDPQIDRGHLVRRQDPNWDPAAVGGQPTGLVEQANLDTFHYTNAAPQHSDMNQGSQLWLGLEDYILNSAQTHGFRACVFTGPVNRDDDPELKPGVFAPREFWKVVVMPDANSTGLHATAYLLSQGDLIRDLLEKRNRTEANEGFVLGAYRTFQVAIADLAEATGYDLSAYVDADPLGKIDREAVGAVVVPLERGEDLVL